MRTSLVGDFVGEGRAEAALAVSRAGGRLMLVGRVDGRLTMRLTPAARRNMPWLASQSKYRSPLTEPSFFPVPSSSSTPTHSPGANPVAPRNRTTACRPSLSSIVCPTPSARLAIVEDLSQLLMSESLESQECEAVVKHVPEHVAKHAPQNMQPP